MYLVYILYLIPYILRKLRDEYDKLEGALKKLGVDPECVVTEEDDEEDGYNAESDLEEELERDTEREVATFVPSVYSLPCAAQLPSSTSNIDNRHPSPSTVSSLKRGRQI